MGKAAVYAHDLRAQIDERAARKAEARRQRQEPELGLFQGHNADSSLQVGKQRQADKQRIMEARADALEQFMAGAERSSRAPQNRKGGGDANDVPAGVSRGAQPQAARRG